MEVSGLGLVIMLKYYTNTQLRKILGCSQSTLDRQLKTMRIKVLRFGSNGLPRYNSYDVHSNIEYGKPYDSLMRHQKQRIKEMLSND